MDENDAKRILDFEVSKKLGANIVSFRLISSKDYRMTFELKIRIGKEDFFCPAYIENLGEWDYNFEITIPSFKIRPDGIRRGASMNKMAVANELVKIAESLVVGRELSVPEQHQKKIAISTLKMNDMGAEIMGGMTKDEARNFLRKIGYSDSRIRQIENS